VRSSRHRRQGKGRALAAALCAIGCGLAFPSVPRAQLNSLQGPIGVSLVPPPVFTERGNPFARPGLSEPQTVLDWLVYPSAFAGLSFDSNPQQASAGSASSVGLRLVPSLLAQRQDGIHNTTIYGVVDSSTSFNRSNADVFSAQTGLTETYLPMPELVVTGQGDFTRQQSAFSNLVTANSLTTLNPTGVGLSPTNGSATYNQFSGAASVQKNFGETFVILGGSAVDLAYDRGSGAAAAASPNGATYTGRGRVGTSLMPDLYGYVEGALDTRDFGALSSSGYRVVSGLGSDGIGLFRGEVFGGYQSESYRSAAIGTVSGLLLGGGVSYYPLPEFAISAGLNEVMGASSLVSTTNSAAGTATRVTSLLGQASYALAREWAASARGGYIHTDYVGSVRRDDALTIGTTFTYTIWRTLGLTFDYQHTELNSNVALQGFSRDMVTIGATYRY